MFRILVCDDEKVTRRGIVTMLKRDLKEDVEYLEAGNGREALKICQTEMLHLVITDICMPLLSGLEFIEQLRKSAPDMTVLIISGYENFEYARQAVRLGVKEYITKPLDKEEFLSLVEKCLAETLKKREDAAARFEERQQSRQLQDEIVATAFLSLLEGQRVEEAKDKLKKWKMLPETPFYICCALEYEYERYQGDLSDFVVKNITDEVLQTCCAYPFASINIRKGTLILLFGVEHLEKPDMLRRNLGQVMEMITSYCRIKSIAGIGSTAASSDQIVRSAREALMAADMKIYGQSGCCMLYDSLPKGERVTMPAKPEQILSCLMEQCRQAPNLTALQMMRESYEGLKQKIHDPKAFPEYTDLWSSFALRRSAEGMLQYLAERTAETGLPQESRSHMGRSMEAYLKLHLTEDLDLGMLAAHFQLSTGYAGTLFHQYTGQSFNEYVAQHRVKLAMQLLQDPTLSVQEAGNQCGYYNAKYFSVIFKKYTGVSPKQYQKNPQYGMKVQV